MVRIVDTAFVSKRADGTVTILKAQELSAELAEALVALTGEASGLLTEGDLMEVAADIDPGMTAAALLAGHRRLGARGRCGAPTASSCWPSA